MVYIKKIVMHGFKSFPRRTEVLFLPEINCIVGPNGSGKSNITDALCFVFGRLSMKSMRAEKSKNLIFMGTKSAAPAREAMVEIFFDNSDRSFYLPKDEISIKRIVRKNGLSIYKINDETKTRQEVLTLLAQAGIDPNGFNIILQDEIKDFVRMNSEERRKIIEEVAGISIYELQKEKSLKEFEKTEEKLKEILAILRERTLQLNNLERERQQALRYKKIEKDIKNLKASIIDSDLNMRKKSKEKIIFEKEKMEKYIEKLKNQKIGLQSSIKDLENKIASINSTIEKSAGFEQEKLNQEIADIRAELAMEGVKFENYNKKIFELSKQKQDIKESINNLELSIRELGKESPTISKNRKEIEAKERELAFLEEERKKQYSIRSELKMIKDKFEDKKKFLQNYLSESDSLLKQIESLSRELYDRETSESKIDSLEKLLSQKKEEMSGINSRERELEKVSFLNRSEIEKQTLLIEKISKIDICPVCKSKITENHVHSIKNETLPRISMLKKQMGENDKELNELGSRREIIKREILDVEKELSMREEDLLKIASITNKKEQIKSIQKNIEELKKELDLIQKRKVSLEKDFDEDLIIEKKYGIALAEVREISLRSKENIDFEISFKQRELERLKISLKQVEGQEEHYKEEILDTKRIVSEKERVLEKKKRQNESLAQTFRGLIQTRDACQMQIRKIEGDSINLNNEIGNKEQEVNNLKIDLAKLDAEIENFETEFFEFKDVEIIKAGREILVQKLSKAQEILSSIGSVNMRSLEVYDGIKKSYDEVREKTDVIVKEKEEILKVINEVDVKKKKTFLKTLYELNEIFSRNFSQLSDKGQISLELENPKEPFEGGVEILVKVGHGKYLDNHSLSGGEQTLVALSLIFAIQELKPYCFYVLDEIDAALDKRNSQRLSELFKKYMKKGQYIVITHNEELIFSANSLYGVSMHDGISKIISMKV